MPRYIPNYDDYEEYADLYEEDRSRAKSKPRPKKKTDNLVEGTVVRARGHHYDVETEQDDVRTCRVRGRLLQEKGKDTLVAVGDRVMILPEGKKKGLIDQVHERTSVLSRRRPGSAYAAEDVILANPDQAMIVFAITHPEPHLRMLDRFLVVAESNELPVIICANKLDLASMDEAKALFGPYEALGYQVVYASASHSPNERRGITELYELLSDKLTVITGPSGVGKSSLINAIYPELDLRVGELRDFGKKGRHTTRGAQLFRLPFGHGTYVADTPGIRELGLYEIDPADLGFYFVEMAPLIHDCHFPNCTHAHEPDCAVKAAVEDGTISQERYDSYLRILDGEDMQEEEW